MLKYSSRKKATLFKTKIQQSNRAISPVIATLLMIAIAVVASLVVYAWVTGYIGGTTSTAGKAIQIQSFAPSGTNLVLYVQNVGQGDVELNKDQSVYVNSDLVAISDPATAKISIPVGQTVGLTVPLPSGYVQGDRLNIKVTTTDGTFMTITGTGTSGGSGGSGGSGTQYNVVVTQGADGVIAPGGTTSYAAGSTPSFTITPNANFHIASITANGGSVAVTAPTGQTYQFAALAADGTLTATFAANTVNYNVVVTQGADGVIAPGGTTSYAAGSTPSFTITPDVGYHIASVTTNAGAQALASPYVFPALAADSTLTATFEADVVAPLTITLRPNTAGSTEELDEDYQSLSNWQCVDEDPSDGSTTYVYGGSDNNWRTDTYNLNNPGLSGTISQVQIFANVRRESQSGAPTSQVSARTAIRLGSGSIEYGNTSPDLSTAWTTYSSTYATKQGNLGSGSWTWTDINNLQIGVSLRSQNDYSWWNNHWSWAQCTQVWVVVTYTPA